MGALDDQDQRDLITGRTDLTLFVNAGAGSGKTAALVRRVLTLVLRDKIRLSTIAAVTFTEKAGAELRDRLRAEFEEQWRTGGVNQEAAQRALDDLDGAPIGTLHAFAQRLLMEHPINAGLPPIIEVLDEVGSSVAFEDRWAELQTALLDDDEVAPALLLGMTLGLNLQHVRSLALLLGKDWDLIGERVLLPAAVTFRIPDLSAFMRQAAEVAGLVQLCTAADDKLLPKFQQLGALVQELNSAPDVESSFRVMDDIAAIKYSNGQKGNWLLQVSEIRASGAELSTRATALLADVLDQCVRHVTRWLAERVLESAQIRRRDGTLEFHDLLVLSRELLRRDDDVRTAVHQDYQRVLLDEFQDTDPIQIELATRICAGSAGHAHRWQDIAVPAGRLFVVGDAKQSIYRFRRASIATYLQAQHFIGEPASLTTNFRTVKPILDWINAVFGALIQEHPDAQPAYVPLHCARPDEGKGPAVTVLGAHAHSDQLNAAGLREREAADVAAAIRQALDQGWQVFDEPQQRWRSARPGDIAVLVPARTSLPFLQEALENAGIPHRAEASSLVYQAPEIRDLLACARAIADTTDQLALVTVLRSPLFGCGDDDLWAWKHDRGTFSIFSPHADHPLSTGPVGAALTYLRGLSHRASWLTPSQVITEIITDRRMFEIAATGHRHRDSWRRMRFVLDQARAWSEVSHGGLRAYLAWAAHQGQETTRVAEAVLPETDADAVRIMTIHAAKGLEFPIVIMSGMTSQPRRSQGVQLLWPPGDGYAAKLTKTIQTGDFQAALPVDEQMDGYEKLRLLYVAATRARDHLIVSLHRVDGSMTSTAAKAIADAQGATVADAVEFGGYDYQVSPAEVAPVSLPPAFQEWLATIEVARARTRVVPAISASGLEGTEPAIALVHHPDPGLAKGPRDLELPPWTKGRYGSAVGRAVHAVLQSVDLGAGSGIDDAVAAQSVAEGVVGQVQLVRSLVESALASDLTKRAATREHWRETYVGTVLNDGTVLEGYIDLIYREDNGELVIVDYKTDAVPTGAVESRVTYYKPQMDAYCQALAAATGYPVSATLLFLSPTVSVPVRMGPIRY